MAYKHAMSCTTVNGIERGITDDRKEVTTISFHNNSRDKVA